MCVLVHPSRNSSPWAQNKTRKTGWSPSQQTSNIKEPPTLPTCCVSQVLFLTSNKELCVSTWSAIVAKKALEQNTNPTNLCANIVHNFDTSIYNKCRYRHANKIGSSPNLQKHTHTHKKNICDVWSSVVCFFWGEGLEMHRKKHITYLTYLYIWVVEQRGTM